MHTTTAPPDARASVDLPTVLDVAAGYLEAHGWCQGSLYGLHDATQPHDWLNDTTMPRACALGALAVAIYGKPTNPSLHGGRWTSTIDHASQAVLDWLGIQTELEEAHYELIEWNDTSGRTAEQVIGTFRAVADEQRRTAR